MIDDGMTEGADNDGTAERGVLLKVDDATYFIPAPFLASCRLDGDDHDRAVDHLVDQTDVEGFVGDMQKAAMIAVFGLGGSVGSAIGGVANHPYEPDAAPLEQQAGMLDMRSLGLRSTSRRLPF